MLIVENLEAIINTDKAPLKVVNGLSFILKEGKTLGIVGESGSGKTMTAYALLRLIDFNEIKGKVLYNNVDLLKVNDLHKYRGGEIAFIMQNPSSSLNPSLKIRKQIEECLTGDITANQLLRDVGISDPEERLENYPHQLSGGMKQRVLIAMALARDPKILIADEPTTGLDVTVQAQILELLNDIKIKRSLSLILIAHDMGVVARMCDDVLVMYAGNMVEYGPVERIFYHSAHPYTKGLLNSVSRIDRERRKRLRPIEGYPPDLYDLKCGCHFDERCSDVKDICRNKTSQIKEIYPGHFTACCLEV